MESEATEIASTPPILEVEQALEVLCRVKRRFSQEPAIFYSFQDAMRAFHSPSVDPCVALARVASVLAGHADIIAAFNAFLPPSYRLRDPGRTKPTMATTITRDVTVKPSPGGGGVRLKGNGRSSDTGEKAGMGVAADESVESGDTRLGATQSGDMLLSIAASGSGALVAAAPPDKALGGAGSRSVGAGSPDEGSTGVCRDGGGGAAVGGERGGGLRGGSDGGGSECVRVEESIRTSVKAGGSLCWGSDGSDRVRAEETGSTSVEGGGIIHRSSDGSGSVCVRAEETSSTPVEGGSTLHRSSDGSGSVCVRAEEASSTSVEGGGTLHRSSDGSGSVCVRAEETSSASVEGGSTLHGGGDGGGSVCVRAEGTSSASVEGGSTLHRSSDGSGSVCVREETSSTSVEGDGSLHRGGDGGGSVCVRAEGSSSASVVVEGGGAAVVRGKEGADGSGSRPSGFSAAAALVSSVKARFLLRPDVCRRFLHVLHTHQNQWDASREQGAPCCDARLGVRDCDGNEVPAGARETVPDGEGEGLGEVEFAGGSGDGDESEGDRDGEWEGERCEALSRREVCAQLCELLKGEEDLLVELKKFLQVDQGSGLPAGDAGDGRGAVAKRRAPTPGPEPASGPVAAKRPRMPSLRDPSLAAAGMHGTLREISFFDRVRCALHSPEVYENFLRCVQLFNHNHVSPSALLDMARPFLGKFPELLVELRNLLEDVRSEGAGSGAVLGVVATEMGARGYSRRVGPSYRSLPETYEQPRSSTRTALCREVLNDTWASFPSWSEDSTFVSSKKTHFEESIYRCEDERFELDVVLETNLATVRVLESVLKRLARLPAEEQARFRLDDALGGSSEVVHRKALQRAYGERGATDIIAALKLNPAATIPHVLKRLKAREDEWREAQRGFTRLWRDQGERFQVRSLDHRGITFRSADTKALRTKALVNEITALRDERVEQQGGVRVGAVRGGAALAGPHLCLEYADRSVLPDAAALILHQARHQAGLRGAELRRAAKILLFLLPDVLFTARADASLIPQDDSDEDEEEEAAGAAAGGSGSGGSGGGAGEAEGAVSGEDGRCREERRCRMVERGERPIGLRERPNPTVSDGGAARDAGEQRGSGGEQRGANLEQRGNVPEQRGASSEQRRASGTSAEQEGDFATSSLDQARELSAVDGVYTLLYANTSWYVFLRLHQLLCARLLAIRSETSTATPGLSREQREVRRDDADRVGADRDGASAGDGGPVAAVGGSAGEGTRRSSAAEPAEPCGPASTTAPGGPDGHYGVFLRHVRDLVDGQLEAPEYEERLRESYGVTAYVAYSMDRLLQNACRQLQHMVCDEACAGVLALYLDGCRGGASGGVLASQAVRAPLEASYQRQARRLLPDEHCYKVMFVKTDGCVLMTMELLDVEEDSPVDLQEIQKWSDYVQRYASSVETSPVVASRAPIFLGRNLWAGGSRPPPGGSRVVFSEGLRCCFRPHSFRMLYVIHSEDVLYRRGALRAARQTLTACSEKRRRAFRRFVRTWRERRASRAEAEGGRVA